MEVLLNELSFHNQFQSFEHFQEGALLEILSFFHLQKNGTTTLLKKSDIYARKIYNNKSLLEILISKDKDGKSDEIRKLKSQLGSIINDPYWDNNKLCVDICKYIYSNTIVNDTSLAEGFERNCDIISVNPSNYILDEIIVSKDNVLKTLKNFYSFNNLIEKQYNQGILTFDFFCKNYFRQTKLDFSLVNSDESFKYITKKNDEEEFLSSFKMFKNMDWNDILQQGGKGKNKAGLAFTRYHNQAHFLNYKPKSPIYKFRTTQKYRVFGYRIDDTFYVLEFDLTHRLSD